MRRERRQSFRLHVANTRHAIGQEHQHVEIAIALIAVRAAAHRFAQRPFNVGATIRHQGRRPVARTLERRYIGRREPIAERAHPRRERDETEAIACVERAEHLQYRCLRLLEFRSAHRTRHVHHYRQITSHALRIAHIGWRDIQQEVAILAAWRMRHDSQSRRGVAKGKKQFDVAAGRIGDRHSAVIVTTHLHRMRRRERTTEPRRLSQRDANVRSRTATFLRAKRVAPAQRVAFLVQNLRETKHDLSRFTGLNREHLRAQQLMTGKCHKRGIAAPTHDLFVNAARLRRVHELTAHLLLAHPERQRLEHGFTRERVVIGAFGHTAASVAELLFDFDACHAPFHRRANAGRDPRDVPWQWCSATRRRRRRFDPALRARSARCSENCGEHQRRAERNQS